MVLSLPLVMFVTSALVTYVALDNYFLRNNGLIVELCASFVVGIWSRGLFMIVFGYVQGWTDFKILLMDCLLDTMFLAFLVLVVGVTLPWLV